MIRKTVIVSTILLWSPSLVKILLLAPFSPAPFFAVTKISCHTGNPRPPITIRNIVVRLTSGESTYLIKLLSPIISIPALQNPEIEWKTPYQIPFARPNSGTNLNEKSTAPIPSTMNVPLTMRIINFTSPDNVSSP